MMDFKEVDLETPAGILADSLAQIFMMTTSDELRQQAYRMFDVENNRDFALAVEARLNEYFKSKQRKLDRRSILQIREEKDGASMILKHFLKTAGLPPDAVEKFSSTNLSDQIKKLERTVNQRSFPRSYLIELENDDLSNIGFCVPGHQGPSNCKRKQLGSLEVGSSVIGDVFSGSDKYEVPDVFLSKKRRSMSLSHSESFHFPNHKYVLQAEANMGNEVGRKEDLKSSHNSADFDEFSDFSDEFDNESLSKLDALKTNGKNQFPSHFNAEFSSSDDTEFSSTNDADFPQSKEGLLTVFKNVRLDEPEYQFHNRLFPGGDISILNTNSVRNPFRKTKSSSE